jgi:hypothetical protein
MLKSPCGKFPPGLTQRTIIQILVEFEEIKINFKKLFSKQQEHIKTLVDTEFCTQDLTFYKENTSNFKKNTQTIFFPTTQTIFFPTTLAYTFPGKSGIRFSGSV